MIIHLYFWTKVRRQEQSGLHPVFPQKTCLGVLSAADVLWDVYQQYGDALCISSEHGSYTETQQRQVKSEKNRYVLSSLKARAGLLYPRHPKVKAVVCPTIPPSPLASCWSEHANETSMQVTVCTV